MVCKQKTKKVFACKRFCVFAMPCRRQGSHRTRTRVCLFTKRPQWIDVQPMEMFVLFLSYSSLVICLVIFFLSATKINQIAVECFFCLLLLSVFIGTSAFRHATAARLVYLAIECGRWWWRACQHDWIHFWLLIMGTLRANRDALRRN